MRFEDRNHVIGIGFSFQVKDKGRIADRTQGGSGKNSAFEAMRGLLPQNPSWRPGRIGEMVRHIVEKLLDPMWVLEAEQFPKLFRSKAEMVVHFGQGTMQCTANRYRARATSC